ncbi:HD domain-containing protein [Streptomyces sp. NPDC052396]|uniref:HD domain-containing protein n=1 Tax=Streptomyces sp. NPDC052396 TaxID=3365689 RepID=UPI0037D24EF3
MRGTDITATTTPVQVAGSPPHARDGPFMTCALSPCLPFLCDYCQAARARWATQLTAQTRLLSVPSVSIRCVRLESRAGEASGVVRRSFGAPDESLWGKARGLAEPYPLVRHLLDTAAVAMYLWDHYLSENQRRSVTAALGLCW